LEGLVFNLLYFSWNIECDKRQHKTRAKMGFFCQKSNQSPIDNCPLSPFNKGEYGKITVSFPNDFLMKITKSTPSSGESPRITSIIIRPSYAHLERELRETFDKEEDVKVIVDRRYDERRKRQQAVEIERRKDERRRTKEELVEVVIPT
jgi:hypothetical protein